MQKQGEGVYEGARARREASREKVKRVKRRSADNRFLPEVYLRPRPAPPRRCQVLGSDLHKFRFEYRHFERIRINVSIYYLGLWRSEENVRMSNNAGTIALTR